MNQIEGVCQTIEKTINQAVQKTLDQLEKDSDLICSTISNRLEKDRFAICYSEAHLTRARNKRRHLAANEKQHGGSEQISGCCLSPDIKSRFPLFSCRADVAYNKSVRLHSFLCGALGIILPTLFILSLIANTISGEQLDKLLGEGVARWVTLLTVSPPTRLMEVFSTEPITERC